VRQDLGRRVVGLLSLVLLIMAVPQRASAYIDPGTGAMLWQMAAAAVIGSLFYARQIVGRVRHRLAIRSDRVMGFLFAACFGLPVSALTLQIFGTHPLPRFNDIFLVGIVLTVYLFTWDSACFLLLISVLVSAWVLPPNGSLRVEGFADRWQMVSFTVVSVLLICLITRLKSGSAKRHPSMETRRMETRSMATGAV
jgi:hypothetical protein